MKTMNRDSEIFSKNQSQISQLLESKIINSSVKKGLSFTTKISSSESISDSKQDNGSIYNNSDFVIHLEDIVDKDVQQKATIHHYSGQNFQILKKDKDFTEKAKFLKQENKQMKFKKYETVEDCLTKKNLDKKTLNKLMTFLLKEKEEIKKFYDMVERDPKIWDVQRDTKKSLTEQILSRIHFKVITNSINQQPKTNQKIKNFVSIKSLLKQSSISSISMLEEDIDGGVLFKKDSCEQDCQEFFKNQLIFLS